MAVGPCYRLITRGGLHSASAHGIPNSHTCRYPGPHTSSNGYPYADSHTQANADSYTGPDPNPYAYGHTLPSL